MNNTIRIITAVVGLVLIGLGVFQMLVPQEVASFGGFEVHAKEGITTETLVLIIIGVVALIASFYKRK